MHIRLSGVALLVTAGVFAQGERGAITGVVKDSSGSVIPAARITVVDIATNVESTTSTTDAGVYRIPYLSPGQYRVTAAASGFKSAVLSTVAVAVAAVAT